MVTVVFVRMRSFSPNFRFSTTPFVIITIVQDRRKRTFLFLFSFFLISLSKSSFVGKISAMIQSSRSDDCREGIRIGREPVVQRIGINGTRSRPTW